MKEQKINLKEMNKENKQKAINIINKTKKSLTKIADQNDDGKFDKEDIIKVTNTIKTNIDEKAKEIEQLFKTRCSEFKEKYKLNFGVYYTPKLFGLGVAQVIV